MNYEIKALLNSIGLMVFVSGIITGCAFFFVGPDWFKLAGCFTAGIIGQVIYGTVVNSFLARRDNFKIAEILAADSLADSQQSMVMPCPYCNVHNKTTIRQQCCYLSIVATL